MTSRDYESVLDICASTLMSQIRNYTEDQLQNLLQDDTRLNAMVDQMPQVSSLPNDKELKLAQSKSLAEYNLSLEPTLKKALAQLEYTHENATKTKKEVEDLKSKLDSFAESRSLDTVCTMLKTLAQDSEDESEKIAEDFKMSSMDIEEFVKQFREKREIAHMRKVKSEKLAELLRQQQYQTRVGGSGLPASHTPYPAASHPHASYPQLGQGYAAPSPKNYNRHSYMS